MLRGVVIFADPDREIPWGRREFEIPIPGGVEPSETRALEIPHPDVIDLPYGPETATRFEDVVALGANATVLVEASVERDRI